MAQPVTSSISILPKPRISVTQSETHKIPGKITVRERLVTRGASCRRVVCLVLWLSLTIETFFFFPIVTPVFDDTQCYIEREREREREREVFETNHSFEPPRPHISVTQSESLEIPG